MLKLLFLIKNQLSWEVRGNFFTKLNGLQMVLNSLLVFKQNKVQDNSEYVEQMADVSHCKKSWLA